MYICLCKGLTESDVEQMGALGLIRPESLTRSLGLEDEDCCGRCANNLEELLEIAERGCPFARSRCA